MDKKTVSHSVSDQIHILRYQHLNGQRRLFGGVLMQWIDEMAGVAAARHCGGNVITASVDSLHFKEPAFLGDMVRLQSRVTYVGHTSMEVRVDTWAEKMDDSGSRLINQAYLVLVAIDDNNNPRPVPGLALETDEDRREWDAGERRNALRRQRREEQF